MAKCTICKACKGKRKCQKTGEMICSLCCGKTRTLDACKGCSFFKTQDQVDYRKVPYFEMQEMAKYSDLQDLAGLMERTIVQVDLKMDVGVDDDLARRLLERLLDKYHFGGDIVCPDPVEQEAVTLFFKIIANELEYVADDKLVQVLGAIHRSVKRRTDGKRGYVNFIAHSV